MVVKTTQGFESGRQLERSVSFDRSRSLTAGFLDGL
jgi:hypothetical protein